MTYSHLTNKKKKLYYNVPKAISKAIPKAIPIDEVNEPVTTRKDRGAAPAPPLPLLPPPLPFARNEKVHFSKKTKPDESGGGPHHHKNWRD